MKLMKKIFEAMLLGAGVCACGNNAEKVVPAIPADPGIESEIRQIMAGMTLEEKIGQMCEITIDVVTDFEASRLPCAAVRQGYGTLLTDDRTI